MIGDLGAPYARLQGERDRLHDLMTLHARRLVEPAEGASLAVRPLDVLDGHIRGHPVALLDALEWALTRAVGEVAIS